jgi:aromatic-L-amino-acid/L-tryptophan decarboxylase
VNDQHHSSPAAARAGSDSLLQESDDQGQAREERHAAVAMDAAEFRRAGHALVDSIAAFLDSIPGRPVTTQERPAELRALLDAERALPADGVPAESLLLSTAELLYGHSLFNGHPRFFGYITSPPAPVGILGDLLAAAVNPNVGSWRLGPIATEIESQAVRWIAELIDYPRDCGGLFVSGGNMANIVALFAARAAAADWDVRAGGVAAGEARRLRVYASAETHTWIQKAADLSGIGTDAIRWIPVGDDLRADSTALREVLERDRAAGDRPMMVVGTAGSVSTGVVDPLFEIAEICREAGVWFHVDGAYGAFAAAVPGTAGDLGALKLADSVAVDPHKWLYAPLEAGCVLVRDVERLRHAFAYYPSYYHFGDEATNYVDLGPQNSRGFRALKVWLALNHAGRNGYIEMIGDDIRLSRLLHDGVVAHAEFEPITQALSITTFRFVLKDLRREVGTTDVETYLNRLNEELLERVQRSGLVFVSNAVIRGRYVLRACIVNFRTDAQDVRAVPDIIARIGRDLDTELRGAAAKTATVSGN